MLTPKLQQANGCVSEAAVKKNGEGSSRRKHSTKRKDGVFLRVSDLGQRPIFQSIDKYINPSKKIGLSEMKVLGQVLSSRKTL